MTMLSPSLIKEGIQLPINIISSEPFPSEQVFKTQIHQTLGKNNAYEFIDKGDRKIEIKVFLRDRNEYDKLISFFADGKPFLLNAPFFPITDAINLDGNISFDPNYNGFSTATLRFTTAENINFNTDNLYFLEPNLASKVSKKSFLDKMFEFGQKAFDFTSDVNGKVGGVTNQIAAYASAIANITAGMASSSSIITNPISSVKASANQVIGGLNDAITAIYGAINAVKQVPSDINDLIDSLTIAGSRLNGLFDLGNSADNAKYNTDFLLEIGNTLSDADNVSPQDNSALIDSQFNDVEYFLDIPSDKTASTVSVLLLCSVLINIYSNIDGIDRLNQKDLDNLRKKAEKIYNKINEYELSNDLSFQLDVVRSQFFKSFRILSNRALIVYFYAITDPEFLVDIVYAVNGNLDYYEETKKLNNIIGDLVFKSIEVVSNG